MSDHEDETINKENAPPKVVPQIITVTNISTKFPYLKKGEYDIRAMKMQNFISSFDLLCWNIILKGNSAKSMTTDNDGNMKIHPHKFKEFKVSKEEGLDKGYDNMQKILTQMNTLKIKPDQEDVNMKFLRGLPPSWSKIDTKGYLSSSSTLSNATFVSTAGSSHGNLSYQESGNGGYTTTHSVSHGFSSSKGSSKSKCSVVDDVIYSFFVHRFEKKHRQKIKFNGRENASNNYKKYKSKEAGKDGSDSKAMVVVDGSIDWDKQTEEGNTEPRSLENFGMVAGLEIASDVDSKGEVVSDDDAIPAGVFVSADDVAAAVVSPHYETELALMGLSTEVFKTIYDFQTCDSSQECSRPNHSDHDSNDSISSVSAPASESRDTIVIDCTRQENFPSVCTSSIETDVKSSKTLCNKFGSFNKESHFRKHKSVTSKSCYVYGSYLHLIKDYDLHEQILVKRNAEGKGKFRRRPTGKPFNLNRPKPVSACQPNPVSTGKATLACNSIPLSVSAGNGILGPRPLNIQPKSTYYHSFTHNNQQIIFPITHNSLYSLYITGGLNGKTAVKPSAGWPWTKYGMSKTKGSKINGGSKSKSWSYAKGPLGRPKSEMTWNQAERIKRCSWCFKFHIHNQYLAVATSCCSTLNPHTAHMTIYYWKLDNKQVTIQFRGGLLGIVIPAARAFCFCCQVFISAGDLFLLKSIKKLQLIINDEDFFI
nr:hypothetical protein [Tanacetum cinerariifolium]